MLGAPIPESPWLDPDVSAEPDARDLSRPGELVGVRHRHAEERRHLWHRQQGTVWPWGGHIPVPRQQARPQDRPELLEVAQDRGGILRGDTAGQRRVCEQLGERRPIGGRPHRPAPTRPSVDHHDPVPIRLTPSAAADPAEPGQDPARCPLGPMEGDLRVAATGGRDGPSASAGDLVGAEDGPVVVVDRALLIPARS
jgi:hypothetical protein